jgi:hypothetical protein
MRGDDLGRMQRAQEDLRRAEQTLAQAASRQAGAQGDSSSAGPGTKEGEVIDAEYADTDKG